MIHVFERTAQEYEASSRLQGRAGCRAALCMLAYPFVLYAVASNGVLRMYLAEIHGWVSLSLFIAFILSIVSGVFAFRAEGWEKSVGVLAAGLGAAINFLVLILTSLR